MFKLTQFIFIFLTLIYFLNLHLNIWSHSIFKAMPLILLIATLNQKLSRNRFMMLAFIFSLAGDIFLVNKQDFFLHGLISFFIAHLFYIVHFWKKIKRFHLRTALYLVIYMLGFLYLLLPYTGELKPAVSAYALVISLMCFNVFSADLTHRKWEARMASVSFVISDSVLAYSLFIQDFSGASLIVMLTYWTAQFLFYRVAYYLKS